MRRVWGGILLAIGILLMTGSGLCSLAVMVPMVMGPGGGGGTAGGILIFVLVIGGLPFALGWGLFYWGRTLIRRDKRLDEDELRDRFG